MPNLEQLRTSRRRAFQRFPSKSSKKFWPSRALKCQTYEGSLDENVPHQLRLFLSAHETITAAYAGFGGLKNGALLKAATDAQFEVLVTADKTIQEEQNMAGRKIALVSLSVNIWRLLRDHTKKIVEAINRALEGSFTRVECCTFQRGSKPPNQ